jgi:hypothetical protein
LPDTLPPDVGDMLPDGPCEPKLRVALEQHLLKQEGGPASGGNPGPFMIEPGERLCLLGHPPLKDLHLGAAMVPSEQAKQALVAIELRTTSVGTVLVIRNHFDKPLAYRAIIKRPGQSPEPTSVCTVLPNLRGLEHWPEAVDVIALGDFRLLAAGAAPECR